MVEILFGFNAKGFSLDKTKIPFRRVPNFDDHVWMAEPELNIFSSEDRWVVYRENKFISQVLMRCVRVIDGTSKQLLVQFRYTDFKFFIYDYSKVFNSLLKLRTQLDCIVINSVADS